MYSEDKKNSRGGARLSKEQKPPKTPGKKKLTTQQKVLRILFIVLTVIAAIIVIMFIAYKLLVVKPQIPNVVEVTEVEQTPGMESYGPKLSGDRKEEFYTFLVIGRDTGGGGNTDTLMVMSYDIPNQKLNVLNIPRDTMVNVPWDVKKINSVYNYAPMYDKDGVDFLKEEISYLIGFQPDFTVVVEWEAVGELVDAIGPVWFDVPYDMNYEDPSQDLYIHLNKGPQNIDGDKAMQLLRWRKNNDKVVNGKVVSYGGYANGDLGRIQTQQDFLKAVIEKCLSSLSVDKIPALASIFMNNVDTKNTLTVNNIAWFAQEAILGGLSMDNVEFMTLPCKGVWVYSRTVGNNQSYVTPIPDETLEMINDYFNPYLEEIALNELDLMMVNDNGSLSSTSGRVEDSYATRPQGGSSGSSSSSGGGSSSSSGSGTVTRPDPETTPTPQASIQPKPTETPGTTPAPESTPQNTPDGGASETPEPTPVITPEPTPQATPDPTPPPTAAPTVQPTTQPEIGPGMEPME